MKDCRIIFLGSEKVGKSSLIHQFMEGSFTDDYRPTVEESYRRMVRLPDGNYANIEILDTAGQSDFPAMRRLRIEHGNAFVVVYAVNDELSFQSAISLCRLIFSIKGRVNVPVVLVGNKLDCDTTRKVSTETATKLALDEMGCSYVESSAKCNLNVDCLFDVLLLKKVQQEEVQEGQPRKTRRSHSSRSLCSQGSTRKQLQRNYSVCSCVMATSDKKKKHVHGCKIM
ncbi:ras-related protein Rap-1b-like [Haliotis rufescens]|uniref:ras-related protein Rap-1b-like n=1 Tax=Haliotis rufescens TaxID=6454 RepID=UPI001EB01E1B|nr:ras-related protein Rap-1b-like [Haliotis rufescens]